MCCSAALEMLGPADLEVLSQRTGARAAAAAAAEAASAICATALRTAQPTRDEAGGQEGGRGCESMEAADETEEAGNRLEVFRASGSSRAVNEAAMEWGRTLNAQVLSPLLPPPFSPKP